jgi:hypothetical protein
MVPEGGNWSFFGAEVYCHHTAMPAMKTKAAKKLTFIGAMIL